jgi:predicted nucleic acid-binding protein
VIVVDASAVLDLLRRVPGADAIEFRLLASGDTLHAPHLIDVEVAQAARRLGAARQLDESRGGQLLADLVAMPIRRYPNGLLLDRVWALRDNLSAYDATYVALAEVLDAPLITRDGRLARTRGHKARIQLV